MGRKSSIGLNNNYLRLLLCWPEWLVRVCRGQKHNRLTFVVRGRRLWRNRLWFAWMGLGENTSRNRLIEWWCSNQFRKKGLNISISLLRPF